MLARKKPTLSAEKGLKGAERIIGNYLKMPELSEGRRRKKVDTRGSNVVKGRQNRAGRAAQPRERGRESERENRRER